MFIRIAGIKKKKRSIFKKGIYSKMKLLLVFKGAFFFTCYTIPILLG